MNVLKIVGATATRTVNAKFVGSSHLCTDIVLAVRVIFIWILLFKLLLSFSISILISSAEMKMAFSIEIGE